MGSFRNPRREPSVSLRPGVRDGLPRKLQGSASGMSSGLPGLFHQMSIASPKSDNQSGGKNWPWLKISQETGRVSVLHLDICPAHSAKDTLESPHRLLFCGLRRATQGPLVLVLPFQAQPGTGSDPEEDSGAQRQALPLGSPHKQGATGPSGTDGAHGGWRMDGRQGLKQPGVTRTALQVAPHFTAEEASSRGHWWKCQGTARESHRRAEASWGQGGGWMSGGHRRGQRDAGSWTQQ